MRLRFLLMAFAWTLVSCATAQRSPAESKNRVYPMREARACEVLVNNFHPENPTVSTLMGVRLGPSNRELGLTSEDVVLRPFRSDGCSVSPDGVGFVKWVHCCVAHDVSYWMGGTKEQKDLADERLRSCIQDVGAPGVADTYFSAVQIGGRPDLWTTYRWGYGWTRLRPFGELTAAERRQVESYSPGPWDTIERRILDSTHEIYAFCTTQDAVAQRGWNEQEKAVFDFLNEYLSRDAVVGWAKPGYFNAERWQFVVQFEKCDEPSTLTFFRNGSQKPVFSSRCDP